MSKLWSNTRECKQNTETEQAEDSPCPKGIEVLLRETARKRYPENVDNPMIAPRDNEVRQSGRVLELQIKNLWIRPTDLSWHFPFLAIIRDSPSKKLSWKVNCEFWKLGMKPRSKKLSKTRCQIKRTGIRFGSHISIGNEVFYIDFLIQFDYAETGQEGKMDNFEFAVGSIWASAILQKGRVDPYSVVSAVSWLAEVGHWRMELQALLNRPSWVR